MQKKKETEEGAPFWMLTMGDMNTLLLTFFVLIYSMLSFEKPKYLKLQAIFREMSGQKISKTAHTIEPDIWFKTDEKGQNNPAESRGGEWREIVVEGATYRAKKDVEGVFFEIGGYFDPFDTGSWELKDSHKLILTQLRELLRDRRTFVRIIGHTDRIGTHDYVLFSEGKISKVGPYDPPSTDPSGFELLGMLRAQAVLNFILQDDARIRQEYIIVSSGGARFPLEGLPAERVIAGKSASRRVEIIITSQK